ncbi:MAG: hypothetical protein PHW87_03610 [Methanothrix sp.]|nr:hypothetical protein [Methanothrix sp.]
MKARMLIAAAENSSQEKGLSGASILMAWPDCRACEAALLARGTLPYL